MISIPIRIVESKTRQGIEKHKFYEFIKIPSELFHHSLVHLRWNYVKEHNHVCYYEFMYFYINLCLFVISA